MERAARAAVRAARARRWLAFAGFWGASLTLVVVAASVMLRLGTAIDAAGHAASALSAPVEASVRLVHRVSAMGVSVLALLALLAVAAIRPVTPARLVALAAIFALTLFLAVIGRLNPGYALASITVGNAAAGLALACAFWWLREQTLPVASPAGNRLAVIAWIALLGLVAQTALGAGASATAMRGDRTLDPLHVFAGPVVLGLVVGAIAIHHRGAISRAWAAAIFAMAILQFVLGLALAAGSGPTRVVEWPHAMLACALALGLVTLLSRHRAPRA